MPHPTEEKKRLNYRKLIRTLRREHEAKKAISEIVWMARRYADGRQTYAVSTFNDAYDVLRDWMGDSIEIKKGDRTIPNWPYATDGNPSFNSELPNRKYYLEPIALSKCCNARVVTSHGCDSDGGHNGKPCNCSEGTMWYECSKCKNSTDLI